MDFHFIPTPASPSISDQVTRLLNMLLNMLLSVDEGVAIVLIAKNIKNQLELVL